MNQDELLKKELDQELAKGAPSDFVEATPVWKRTSALVALFALLATVSYALMGELATSYSFLFASVPSAPGDLIGWILKLLMSLAVVVAIPLWGLRLSKGMKEGRIASRGALDIYLFVTTGFLAASMLDFSPIDPSFSAAIAIPRAEKDSSKPSEKPPISSELKRKALAEFEKSDLSSAVKTNIKSAIVTPEMTDDQARAMIELLVKETRESFATWKIAPFGLCMLLLLLILQSWSRTEPGAYDDKAFRAEVMKAEHRPSVASEEFESPADWKKAGQVMTAFTLVESLCILVLSPDLFGRLSAAFAYGFGNHFPGGVLISLLFSLISGFAIASGLSKQRSWARSFAELRVSLGLGQVIVFLLLAELFVSEQIWPLVPFLGLVGMLVLSIRALSRTRQPFFQA